MGGLKVRRADLSLAYEGGDLGAFIESESTSFSFTEHAHGAADEISLTLKDEQGLWRGEWLPPKGAQLEAWIRTEDWKKQGDDEELDCGIFEITNLRLSGPPGTLNLTAQSSLVTKPFMREKKNFPWTNTNLKALAQEIAGRNGLTLFWEAWAEDEVGRRIDREDQRNQTDAHFLTKLAEKWGFNVKVMRQKLILYSAKQFDSRPPARTIKCAGGKVKSWSFDTQAHDVYRACRIEFYNPDRKKYFSHTYTPENAPASGAVHVVRRECKSMAEAEERAKRELRKANKVETKGSLTLVGDVTLFAGLTYRLEDFGKLDGIFFAEKAAHSYSPGEGYTTTLELRKTLPY